MTRTGQLELEYGTRAALDRAGEDWVNRAKHVVAIFASAGMPFTSDDVRARMEDDPPPNANAWGSLFNACANEGWIRDCGTVVRSTRPDAHRRKLTVWVAAS